MSEKEEVRLFWDEQATKYKNSALATTPDLLSHELEVKEILNHLKDGDNVLNIGCGNGLKDLEFCKNKNIKIKGIDFSKEMILSAIDNLNKNCEFEDRISFEYGDILDLKEDPLYNIVITSRCLINLGNHEQQVKAIDNVYNLLVEDGVYLMMENTKEGLHKINSVRIQFGLDCIKERWHNNYIDEKKLLPYLQRKFKNVEVINFASSYFLISRTINALTTEYGKEIDYLSKINTYASQLPPLGDYSPLKLFKLTK